MAFSQQVAAAVRQNNSLLCVGLDPLFEKMPAHLSRDEQGIYTFCRQIIDATHDVVCGFKPQVAYFASQHAEAVLIDLIAYIHQNYPSLPVILDAKRGDIGITAEQYAVEAFERFNADAVTLNPYMGFDAAEPFLAYQDKGCIFLCRTSNSGAVDFQDLDCGGQPLYERVADTIAQKWNKYNNCALVVGATAPKQMESVRSLVGEMLLLVPGIGAQGGDLQKTLAAGLNQANEGLMINASRSIIYAANDEVFADKARLAAFELQMQINQYR